MATTAEMVQLWDAVNEYAASCGGDTSDKTVSMRRMKAVAAIGRIFETARVSAQAEIVGNLEAGLRGKDGIYPDWLYEARDAIRHSDGKIPWLQDLLGILGWQGGTVHQALSAVRRLVERSKECADD